MANSPINGWIEHAKQVAASGPQTNYTVPASRLAKPIAAIVTAADFPIDPHHLTGAAPGTFYVIRNTAGLVPPGAGDGADFSVGASLEFAVQVLGVQHVMVMVSPNCGFLNCLLNEDAAGIASIVDGQYLPSWTQLTASAINRVGSANIPAEQRMSICSQELTRISFENLMTYPWILDRVFNGSLALHGWYYDEDRGVVSWFDPAADEFVTD
jgi:carbonic anhydrase